MSLSALRRRIARLEAANQKLKSKLRSKKETLRRSQGKGISREALSAQLARQKAQEREAKAQRVAQQAANAFRPRKSEHGKIVFIGTKGQRGASSKGRSGYFAKVTKNGKKRLLKQVTHGYRATKKSEASIPERKAGKKAYAEFIRQQRVTVGSGSEQQPVTKTKGKASGMRKGHDFDSTVINKIASSLGKAANGQASQRSFAIEVRAEIEVPGEGNRYIEFATQARFPDHLKISAHWVRELVRRQLYGHLSRQLSYYGYVSSGSANHIRSLPINRGKKRENWKTKTGERWQGAGKDTVRIISLDWQIQQAK